MKKLFITILLVLFTFSVASAESKTLRFGYEHDGIDVVEFRLYSSTSGYNVYTKDVNGANIN